MDRMHILLWSPKGSSTKFYGGPPIVSFRLYRHRNRQTTSVTLAHGSLAQPAHAEVFDERNLIFPLHHLDASAPGVLAGGMALSFKSTPAGSLAQTVRKVVFIRRATAWVTCNAKRFDVFHGLGAHSDTLIAALRAEGLGLPAVVTTVIESELTRGSRLATITGVHRRRLAGLTHVSAVVAISENIRDRLLEIGVPDEKIVKLPLCGVDTDLFRPVPANFEGAALRRQLGFADRPTCLFVGSIVARKRPHLLISALADLKRQGTDAQVVLAGPEQDKRYSADMRREAERLGVSDRLVWLGFTENIAPVMQAADALALPSTDEGMPGVLMEAMACAVPCVYTDISGARDLIDDGLNGRIISADGAGLAEALVPYLSQPLLAAQHGRRAREKIEAEFGNRAVFGKYLQVFENVRSGRKPGEHARAA